MVVLQLITLFCFKVFGSSIAHLIEDQSAILRDPDTPFNKVDDEVFCDDYEREKGSQSFFVAPLFSGKVASFGDCKLKCINEIPCKYMAYWRSKKCETYRSCFKRTKEPGSKISLYRKQSPCEGTLVAYLELISREFPKDTIRPLYLPFEWDVYAGNPHVLSKYDNPNFSCFCTGLTWMTCGIYLTREAQTTEVRAVSDRLRPDDDGNMRAPFSFKPNAMSMYGGETRFIAFTPPSGFVLAEFRLPEHAIDEFQDTAGCIHMKQCLAVLPGGCPIQRRPLESGEPVYIFKDSIFGYAPEHETPLACISVKGMRSYIVNEDNKQNTGFVDPLGRLRHEIGKEPRRRVNIRQDYVLYFVFDDLAMSSGICNWKEAPVEPSSSASGSGSAQAGGPSVEERMDQLGLEDAPSSEGSGKGSKKKKKKKKSAGTSQAGPSQGGPSSGDTEDPQEGPKSAPSSQSPEFGPRGEEVPGPSSLPDPLFGSSGSPFSAGSPSSDPDPKIRVVLSDTDITKLKRSFAQAQERRAKGRDSRVEISNNSMSIPLQKKILSIFSLSLMILIIFWGICFSKKHTNDVYLEFSL